MKYMRYMDAFTMISDLEPTFLEGLSEEQREILEHVDDYEAICYKTNGKTVQIMDSINDDVYAKESMEDFLQHTLEYLEEEYERDCKCG